MWRERKKSASARKKHVLSSFDRFYPLQSHDRECISSSAVKRGTAGKLRTLPVQSILVLRIRRFPRDRSSSPVERLRARMAPTPMRGVKEKIYRGTLLRDRETKNETERSTVPRSSTRRGQMGIPTADLRPLPPPTFPNDVYTDVKFHVASVQVGTFAAYISPMYGCAGLRT